LLFISVPSTIHDEIKEDLCGRPVCPFRGIVVRREFYHGEDRGKRKGGTFHLP
jgi:hypothetical protein